MKHLRGHHRKCLANNGKDIPSNMSHPTGKQHKAWHTLTGHMSPWNIAHFFNEVFLDPEYKFLVVRR
jgi:hypothetical protein